MPVPRTLRQRSEKFHENITKRGKIENSGKKESGLGVGPVVLGVLLFVVVGSALLQVIRGF